MKNVFLFFNKIKFFLFFMLIQLFVFKIITSNSGYQQASYFNSSASVSGWFYAQNKSIREYFELKSENENLTHQNALLKEESFYNYTLISDNEILIDKARYKKKYFFQPATVIQNSTRRKKNIVTLDVGKSQKVTKEMGIVSSRGVVGFVKDVSEHYATVLSMMNTDFNITVIPLDDSCEGTLYWDKKDKINEATVRGIPSYFNIKVGDSIVTKGSSGFFPKNEMVGTVTQVTKDAGSNNFILKLKTSVDFYALNSVFVVKNTYKEELDSLQEILNK